MATRINGPEAEWSAGRDPERLLTGYPHPLGERKLRLLGCGCCRAVWDRFIDDRSRKAVEVVERFADGLATVSDMEAAGEDASAADVHAFSTISTHGRRRAQFGWRTAWAAYTLTNIPPGPDPLPTVLDDLITALDQLQYTRRGDIRRVRAAQADLVRDVFGDPFRPAALNTAWSTPTVVALARGIYADRAFDILPILADALEEAGCEDEPLLRHCRAGGPHVRGCWVVDLVLGKM